MLSGHRKRLTGRSTSGRWSSRRPTGPTGARVAGSSSQERPPSTVATRRFPFSGTSAVLTWSCMPSGPSRDTPRDSKRRSVSATASCSSRSVVRSRRDVIVGTSPSRSTRHTSESPLKPASVSRSDSDWKNTWPAMSDGSSPSSSVSGVVACSAVTRRLNALGTRAQRSRPGVGVGAPNGPPASGSGAGGAAHPDIGNPTAAIPAPAPSAVRKRLRSMAVSPSWIPLRRPGPSPSRRVRGPVRRPVVPG